MDNPPKPQKLCFVTVGATVSFNALIQAVISPAFIQALLNESYTEVRVQYGKDGYEAFVNAVNHVRAMNGDRLPAGLAISGFDLAITARELTKELVKTQSKGQSRAQGACISHAGTGSLLDGMTYGVPVVLVPNPTLANNHQEQLAKHFAKRHYCIHGHVNNLLPVVREIEDWRTEMNKPMREQWKDDEPRPEKRYKMDPILTLLHDHMDAEMGFAQVE
ncbi:hypothetical protein BT63DRAFT_17633 [Microthyrium microscopicum]|uniref:UDP-N-acetylglucosamine transferase subunit ALG13 n=1 Tax=Microthyrium microscopicum TaxID=703497 RepID=A0A6A6UUF7_9PEZI|nr:hypothetical protein BT63DRAFT_17633 [Microthyrium microscopicum]